MKGEYSKALNYICKSSQADTTDPDRIFKLAYQYDFYMNEINKALGFYHQYLSLTSKDTKVTEEMSYLDFSQKRAKEITKGISISTKHIN